MSFFCVLLCMCVIIISNVKSQCLYTFNDFDDWTIISGKWNSAFNGNGIQMNEGNGDGIAWIGDKIPESKEWNEYTITVDMKIVPTMDGNSIHANAGIIFNAQKVTSGNDTEYMYYGINAFEDEALFGFYMNGDWNSVNSTMITMDQENGVILKAIVNGNVGKIYLNDQLILNEVNLEYSFGSIGLRSSMTGAIYSSVQVNAPCNDIILMTAQSLPPTNIPSNDPTIEPTFSMTASPSISSISPTIGPTVTDNSRTNKNSQNKIIRIIEIAGGGGVFILLCCGLAIYICHSKKGNNKDDYKYAILKDEPSLHKIKPAISIHKSMNLNNNNNNNNRSSTVDDHDNVELISTSQGWLNESSSSDNDSNAFKKPV